jgi:hypothetical protein
MEERILLGIARTEERILLAIATASAQIVDAIRQMGAEHNANREATADRIIQHTSAFLGAVLGGADPVDLAERLNVPGPTTPPGGPANDDAPAPEGEAPPASEPRPLSLERIAGLDPARLARVDALAAERNLTREEMLLVIAKKGLGIPEAGLSEEEWEALRVETFEKRYEAPSPKTERPVPPGVADLAEQLRARVLFWCPTAIPEATRTAVLNVAPALRALLDALDAWLTGRTALLPGQAAYVEEEVRALRRLVWGIS